MSDCILEDDEEILWQSKSSSKIQLIIFLISIISLISSISIFFVILEFLNYNILLSILYGSLFGLLGCGLPGFGILYSIIMLAIINNFQTTYIATNRRMFSRTKERAYIEYHTFDYSKIAKIEIKPTLLLKKKVALIRIFPKSKFTDPYEYRFLFYEEQGVKVPQLLIRNYYIFYNISDYKSLLKILQQHQIKANFKSYFRNSPK